MKKKMLAAAILAACAAGAFAQTAAPAAPAAPAATPDHTFTGNLTVATDYRFRGLSQTFKGPAIQGGFDYSHSSGFYLGNWNSNVSNTQYNNGAAIEMDFYGGYKWELVKGVNADVGLLYYYYPGAEIQGTTKKYNNGEIYFGVTLISLSQACAAGFPVRPRAPQAIPAWRGSWPIPALEYQTPRESPCPAGSGPGSPWL